jgi:alpha-L-rhamnosidase
MLKLKKEVLLLVLMLMAALAGQSQTAVQTALCDNRIDPVGIDPLDLFFSWEIQSSQQAVTQSGYQLVIASSQEKLNAGAFDIWNTDLVKSSQSIQVHYKGKPLSPAQTYFWKVRIWDNANKPTAWSKTQNFTTGIFREEDWKNARWIGLEDMPDAQRIVPFVHMRMKPGDPRIMPNAISPLLRKEFAAGKKVRQALLFISGLGHYEASLNGKKVGKAFLSPGWTSYDKTILYNTYDVTKQIRQGANAIGVLIGNGFYNISQERYVKGSGAFGKPKMIAMLKLTFSDGSTRYVVSDESWKATPSPVTFNTIYGGEDYDARLEQKGWNNAGFDAKTWKSALVIRSTQARLFLDSLTTPKKATLKKGATVYDFGQNISGVPKIKVKGKAGQTIRITPAELLDAQGDVKQADGVTPHFYTYTLKGEGEETWQPRFTYFAVRYVKIEDADDSGLPVVTSLKLLHNRNAAPSNGSFSCSNDLFNKIWSMIDWAVKSNIQSYITDNPQREKLSWQGEQNFMRTAINYNYEMYNLYRSLIQNMRDAQHSSGLVPDIAPEYIQFEGPFVDSPEWGSTAILDTWFLYESYGDTAMINKTYDMMTRYADFLTSRAESNLLNYGLGDWLDLGNVTPKGLTATAYYFHCADALSKMADLVGKKGDASRYRDLANQIKTAFNAKFFHPDTKTYATGSQTAMAMPLSMGIVEEQYKQEVLRKLVQNIQSVDLNRLTAGDVGHRYLVKALYENGHPETLFNMTNRDDVPGYGYLLKRGATALVETWDGKASQNQLAMGHILEWFHGGIAGIGQMSNSVAFRHIKIRPQPAGDLTHAEGSFHSPYGWIRSSWTKSENGFSLTVEIPANSRASVYVPARATSRMNMNGKNVQHTMSDEQSAVLELGSGKYTIKVD